MELNVIECVVDLLVNVWKYRRLTNPFDVLTIPSARQESLKMQYVGIPKSNCSAPGYGPLVDAESYVRLSQLTHAEPGRKPTRLSIAAVHGLFGLIPRKAIRRRHLRLTMGRHAINGNRGLPIVWNVN